MLAREVDLGMYHAHVSRERIISREGLLLDTEDTPDFLFSVVVNGAFVSRQIVWPREDTVAQLSSGRIDTLAFVRPSL